MGGTTFDVSALRNRQLVVTPEATFGMEMLGIPKIDVRSVGAGGGSIAWVDRGRPAEGRVRRAPARGRGRPATGSAARKRRSPTPMSCWASSIPTIILGGKIKLDRAKAEAAVGKIAAKLKLSLEAAAYAIYTTSNHNMIAAIEDITINEGIDPRDSYVVSGGGATACHIGEMARLLGIKSFMVPKFAAGLSAYGGLISDVRWEEIGDAAHHRPRFRLLAKVNKLLADLTQARRRVPEAGAHSPPTSSDSNIAFQGRYLYQSWDIEVSFDMTGGKLGKDDLPRLVAAFHQMHERIYTIKDEADIVEFTTWKVRAIGDTGGRSRRGKALPPQQGQAKPKSRRAVFLGSSGRQEVPVYDGTVLGTGAVIDGPALIEQPTTTLLLLAKQQARTDDHGNFLVEQR